MCMLIYPTAMKSKTIPWALIEELLTEQEKDRAFIEERLPATPQSVTNWKTRGVPQAHARALSDLFGTSADYLLGKPGVKRYATSPNFRHGSANPSDNHVKLNVVSNKKQEFDKNVTPAAVGTRAIPVISAIQAGALKEITDPYEAGDGFAIIYTDDDYSRWAFGLEIEGDSMAPEFKAGDRVIIEPDWVPRPGECVAAKNGSGEATFKKYRERGIDKDGHMIFELVPLNEDYPTIRSDVTPLVIIGVMAEHRKKTRRR